MPQVCRTCFQEAAEKNCVQLEHDGQSLDIKSKIEFCIPEMDLSLTLKPSVCLLCINLLNNAYTFKKQCLDTEHSIKKFLFGLQGVQGAVELKDVYAFKRQSASSLKLPDLEKKVVDDLNHLLDDALSNSGSATSIGIEEVKVEIVENCVEEDVILLDDDEEDEELLVQKNSEDELQREPPKKTIKPVRHKGKRKLRDKPYSVSNDESVPMACEFCAFACFNIDSFLEHLKTHKDKWSSGYKPYFCPLCVYRSKLKHVFIMHMKIHNIHATIRVRTPGQGRCNKCPFVTAMSGKWRSLLNNHKCLST